jgi:hypothetical protein
VSESGHGQHNGEHTPVFSSRAPAGGNCTACSKPVALNQRRCPSCGAWQRPWSVGGKPERWAKYPVGGSGRPDEYGGNTGSHTEVQSSVWVRWGPNGEYVRQSTPDGKPAPSGAHTPIRRKRGK